MREPSRVTRLLERDRGDAIPGLAAGVVHSPELKVLVAVREYARTVQRGDDGAGGRDAVRPELTGDFGRVVLAFVLQRGDPGGRSAGIVPRGDGKGGRMGQYSGFACLLRLSCPRGADGGVF